jgi:hypothetical protein
MPGLKLTIQLLFCLISPVLVYLYDRNIAQHIPHQTISELPSLVAYALITVVFWVLYGSKETQASQAKAPVLVGILAAYGFVFLTMFISYYLPSEELFNYLVGKWIYTKTPMSFEEARNVIAANTTEGRSFSYSYLAYVIFFASWEEIQFRYLMFAGLLRSLEINRVNRSIGIAIAMTMSSIAFMLIHDLDKIATTGLNLLLAGAIAAFLYLRFGLIAACVYHSLFNISTSPFLYDSNQLYDWNGFWFQVGSITALVSYLVLEIIRFVKLRKHSSDRLNGTI